MLRPELSGKGDSLAVGIPVPVDVEVGVAPFAEASPVVVEVFTGEAIVCDERGENFDYIVLFEFLVDKFHFLVFVSDFEKELDLGDAVFVLIVEFDPAQPEPEIGEVFLMPRPFARLLFL